MVVAQSQNFTVWFLSDKSLTGDTNIIPCFKTVADLIIHDIIHSRRCLVSARLKFFLNSVDAIEASMAYLNVKYKQPLPVLTTP